MSLLIGGFFALFFLGIFVPLAHAATYYVDSVGGNNANNGTSSSTPWQTIAKVNSSTFNPGDSILFKRGDIWREQLSIPSSGATSSPITFRAYGTGMNPEIAGSNIVATSSWSLVSGSMYKATVTPTPINIYIDDPNTGSSTVPLAIETNSSTVSSTAGSWYYATSTQLLYIRLVDLSNPSGHTVEASVRPFGIFSEMHSFITVQNIDVKQATEVGIFCEQ